MQERTVIRVDKIDRYILAMGNENEILAMYKRNSVTEWLQKTGQATDNVNNGKLTIMKIFIFLHFFYREET